MLKLDCFNAAEKNDIRRLLNLKIMRRRGGHDVFKVLPSRVHKLTPEQAFRKKFYPVWALLEAIGDIDVPRLEDAGEDILMVNTCGVKHCVSPEHMQWVRKGAYRASFHKDLFHHPKSNWTPNSIARLKRLRKAGGSTHTIAKKLGVAPMTIWKACNELGI